jgi:hypothetical protein
MRDDAPKPEKGVDKPEAADKPEKAAEKSAAE